MKNEPVSIPKEIFEKLEQYSKQLGIDIIKLEDELIEYYKEDKANHKRSSDLKHWEIAHYTLRRQHRTGIKSPALTFVGYIFGDSGLIDFVEIMKRKALAIYSLDKERAVQMHLTTPDGIPLDTRERVDFKENPRFLQPFREDDHSWSRTLYGIAGIGNQMKDTKFFSLRFSGDKAREIIPPFNKLVRFRATIRNSGNDFELNATSVTKIEELDETLEEEKIEEILRNTKDIYRIIELEKVFELTESNTPILVEAVVNSISPEPLPKSNNRIIFLDDPDLPLDAQGVVCFMPYHIPLDFKEDSRVIFLGTLSKSTLNNQERIVINGLGYFCSSDMRK